MDFIKDFKSFCEHDKLKAIGFIGCGNLGSAILQGILKSNLFKPEEIIVSAKTENSILRLQKLHVNATLNNQNVLEQSRVIFLCVKPHYLDDVARSLIGFNRKKLERKQLVSVLAGTSIEKIRETLNLQEISIIRSMPNTPAMVMAAATAISSRDKDDNDTAINYIITKEIFKTLGIVEVVSDENLFHAVTGLSGSGPAYIYTLIEALSDGGVKQGLTRDFATKFAAQTVYGAAKMILETGLHPGQAKDQVSSAGGTTIHAIHELEKGGLRSTMISAVEAAAKRSIEMSKK